MPSLGNLWYQLGIKDLTDADLQRINTKLKNLGAGITLTPEITKALAQAAVPTGIKIELTPTITNEALAKAVENKVMKVEVSPLLTNLRKAIKDATTQSPVEIEVGPNVTKLRNLVTNALNRQGYTLNISTVNDSFAKVVQQKLNGRAYTVTIHANAAEIVRSVQASLMQVQSRSFGLKVSRNILYRSIDEALGQKRFNINIAVSHDQARKAVQDALLRAQVMGKDQALAYQRLQTGEMKAAQAELMRLKAAHMGAADAAKTHASASINLGGAMGSNIKIAGELGSAMASMYSIHAAKEFLSQVIEIGGELEHQKIAMDTIFGDKGKTAELFGQIKGLARQSPFGVMELTSSVKRLSAYGVEYNEIYDTAKRLADISAATSVDINRLILAFGKTKSRGFLDGLEAKQFAYANIPIYEMVRKKLEELEGQAVTTADVMARMKKREIGFDIVKDVLWDITDPGGKFYNMQEALAGSVKTSWKLVRDNIELMFGEIAESSVGSGLKSVAEILQGLTRNWRTMGAVIGTAAIGLGTYKVAMLAANMVMDKGLISTVKQNASLKMQRYHANLAAQSYRNLTQAEEEGYLVASASHKLTGLRIFSRKRLTEAEVAAMLNQKKLTKEQLLQLVALRKVTAADAERLLITKTTTAADAALIKAEIAKAAAVKRGTVVWMHMKAAMAGVAGVMKTLVWNPFTLVFAALTVGAGLWEKHREQIQKTKEATDAFAQKGREGFENLIKSANDLNSLDPTIMSGHELSNRIEEMKTTLKDYSLTAEETFENVFNKDNNGKIRSQKEQFEMLRDAVNETAEAYRNMKNGEKSTVFKSKKSEEVNESSKKSNEAEVNVSDAYTELLQYSNLLDDILKKAQINKNKKGAVDIDEEATKQLQEQLKLAESLDETLKIIYSLVPEDGSLYFPGTTDPRVKAALEAYIDRLHEQKQAEDAVTASMRQKLQELQNIHKEQYKNWNPTNNQRQAEEYLQEAKAFAEASEEMSAAQKSLFMDLAYESIGKVSPRIREMREQIEKMVKTMQVAPDQFGLTKELLEYVKLVERIRSLPKEQQEQTIEDYEKLDLEKYVLLSYNVATDSDRYMNQIKEALIQSAEEKYPELSDTIHNLIESDQFTAYIQLKLKNGWQDGFMQDFNNLDEWKQNFVMAAVPSNDIRKELLNAIAGTQTVTEAATALRKLRKEADEVIQNEGAILLKIRPTIDLSQPFNPHLFDNEDAVVQQAAKKTLEAINKKVAATNSLNAYGLPLTDPTKNNKKGNKKGSQKDEFAEAIKERINLLKKAKSEYESLAKLVGRESASKRLADSPIFAGLKANKFLPEQAIPKTLDDYEKALDELQEKLTAKGLKTKKHRELNVEIEQVKFDINKKRTEEQLKLALDKVSKEAERQLADWNLYDKVRKATGNKKLAMNLAFGINAEGQTDYVQMIKERFNAIAKAGKSTLTFDTATPELLAAAPEEVRKAWEKANDDILKYFDQQRVEAADLYNEYQTLADKITAINGKRQRALEALNGKHDDGNGNMVYNVANPDERKRMAALINSSADWEIYRQGEDYLRFFSSIYSLALNDVRRIGETIKLHLNEQFREGKLNIKEYADEIRKVNEQIQKAENAKSPFLMRVTSGKKGEIDRKIETEEGKLFSSPEYKEAIARQIASYRRLNELKQRGVKESDEEYQNAAKIAAASDTQLSNLTKSVDRLREQKRQLEDVATIFTYISQQSRGLGDVFNDIKTISGAMGIDTDTDKFDTAEALVNTMMAVANGMQKFNEALSNEDYAGMAAAVSSIAASAASGEENKHDRKKSRKLKEASAEFKQLQAVIDGINRRMEHFLGNGKGVMTDAIQKDIDALKTLKEGTSEYERTLKRVNAYNEGGAYSYQRQLMEEQMDALQKQYDAENGKKDKDVEAMQDMQNQMDELRDQILYFAEDVANDLYGIDLKGWASQLGDGLFEAWKKGEDGAEAFKRTAMDILGQVMNKVLTIGLLEPMMQGLSDYLFGTEEERKANNGKAGAFGTDFELKPDELEKVGEYLMKGLEGVDAYNSALDTLDDFMKNKYGISMKGDEESKSGLSAGIQGVTEDTADLLASYINAIRSDVATQTFEHWPKLLNEVLPQMNVIAESQLAAQQQIAENTLRNAIAAEMIVKSNDDISRLLVKVTQGGAKFYVN